MCNNQEPEMENEKLHISNTSHSDILYKWNLEPKTYISIYWM